MDQHQHKNSELNAEAFEPIKKLFSSSTPVSAFQISTESPLKSRQKTPEKTIKRKCHEIWVWCAALWPGNSPTETRSWTSQTRTLGRWPHSPVTRYRPSSDLTKEKNQSMRIAINQATRPSSDRNRKNLSIRIAINQAIKEVFRRENQGLKVYPVDGSSVFSMTGTYF
jgi:hypothetical protein